MLENRSSLRDPVRGLVLTGFNILMDYSYIFSFSKTGNLIYISHLDLMRLFDRALRRAELSVCLTKGFNPHFKLKLKRALKLGVVSENEEGEFVLLEKFDVDQVKERLQKVLPQGIKITDVMLGGIKGEEKRNFN